MFQKPETLNPQHEPLTHHQNKPVISVSALADHKIKTCVNQSNQRHPRSNTSAAPSVQLTQHNPLQRNSVHLGVNPNHKVHKESTMQTKLYEVKAVIP